MNQQNWISDWRNSGQEEYLAKVPLYYKKYERPKHTHCDFCWARFDTEDVPQDLHYGYTTVDNYPWICEECFQDLKDFFEWTVVEE